MFYFLTSREDILTSAIELAQVKRLKIFDRLNQPAKIVTMLYNYDHQEAEAKLGTTDRVINLYQYFQQLPFRKGDDQALVDQILNQPGFKVTGLTAYYDGKLRIKVKMRGDRLYYVDYLDHFGFTDRRDFYDLGCRTYSEYFEDKARVVMRQYYDGQGRPKITYHYRGGKGNTPVLTLVQLNDHGVERQFNNDNGLRAYFLDCLVHDDPQAVLISDRSDYTLEAFKLMEKRVPTYQVFHSAFTQNAQPQGEIFPAYGSVKQMLSNGQLTGLISATDREAQQAGQRFGTKRSYGIPVTYLPDKLLHKQIPFSQRTPGQLIAVARLTNVKRLDHLIETTVLLKRKHPEVNLKIYGYDDSWNNYATANSLKNLVKERQAGDYVSFCGYQHDLSAVYEHALIEVLTSSYEGFAMALLEAQGHACPAVSYDINYGPAEIIEDGVSGRLVPAGDTHTLYQVLDELLSDPGKLAGYSAHAQQAAARFSFDQVMAKWADFLAKEKLN